MVTVRDDAIGGFNAFVDGQRQVEGEANLTLVLFDHEVITVHDNIPLNKVPELTRETFVPRGATALFDAVGVTMHKVGERLAAMSEVDRPDKVIVAILTDGHENSSKTFTFNGLASAIKHQQEKYSWEFVFLAADQQSFDQATLMGIPQGDVIRFDATKEGTAMAYSDMTRSVIGKRMQQ